MKNLKRGMKVRIKWGSPITRKSYLGYSEGMKRLEGTYQIIDSIIGHEVEFEASNYTWHIDDIQVAPEPKGPNLLLFNPKELL
jgi:hypothetical protein